MVIWIWAVAWLATVIAAWRLRNRVYATFFGVLVGIQVLIWIGLFREPQPEHYVFWGLSGLVFVHYLALTRPRMRSLLYRFVVSWPAQWFTAGTILALPWAVVAALGFDPVGWWAPWIIATIGLFQSFRSKREVVDVSLDSSDRGELRRADPGGPTSDSPVRIAHLTDTHLGPFVSEERLRRACERLVAMEPDIVVLTGDFMTMESSDDAALVTRALSPLRKLEGCVFACRGNHDLEAPDVVAEACRANGIRLLIDEEAIFSTPNGDVQIVGIDWKFRHREEHVREVSQSIPRRDGHSRVVLLHDPGQFQYVPDGLGDLVLSGHTHGGQVGLVDLGIDVTMVSVFTSLPDQGFWSKGRNRLYVNRGLGHYGFPLRIGVSAEEALIRLHPA